MSVKAGLDGGLVGVLGGPLGELSGHFARAGSPAAAASPPALPGPHPQAVRANGISRNAAIADNAFATMNPRVG
jgi:hypothetical protein